MNVARVKRDWERIAGETLQVQQLTGAVYAFGSELATLRLLKEYRQSSGATANHSENRDAFYFRLEF